MTKLKVLKCKFGHINYLPKEIGSLKNLKELDLSKNEVISFPKEIGELHSLEVLNLSQNENLYKLPEIISLLSKLKSLTYPHVLFPKKQ